MTPIVSDQVVRPPAAGLKGWLMQKALTAAPAAFAILRRMRPILRIGSTYIVSRYDDVVEVFETDTAFSVPYKANLDVITGNQPFFLGLQDGPDYRAALMAMQRVVKRDDLTALAAKAATLAQAAVAACDGRIDVVADLVRPATFRLFSDYLGVPEPATGRLDVWATRLFEFQFASSPSDLALRAEVDAIAPALRAHIDAEMARRKTSGSPSDDVLGRCLAAQAQGVPGYSDAEIRTGILCMIIGGPPQPPMVVPQAMEQLLRRPKALQAAIKAAQTDNDASLALTLREAMRFDPLAPGLPRMVVQDAILAQGTRRETSMPKGSTVIAAFASAMMDDRRIPNPTAFDATRRPHEYILFGHGLHECFGRHINAAILHQFLKPLLQQPNLRREDGPEGSLTKSGIFADRLVVRFG